MANDGEVKIGTKVDTSGLDKGLKSVKGKVENSSKEIGKGTKATKALKSALDETGNSATGFASRLSSVASKGGLVAAGITAAIMAAKKYIDVLKQASEAYKVQEKAEKALAKAAENNPYLTSESVEHLKAYASELQEISNYGDEMSIDIMAQLASTGRTEEEIMKIMGAAADYAAAKHIDLKTAAETLNATYSGMSGTMGKQIAEIKNLTDEQLKNGDAIDLIAQKYKGFAKESADSGTQAKNAFGDLMESIGSVVNSSFEKIGEKLKGFFKDMTQAVNDFKEWLDDLSFSFGGGREGIEEFVEEIIDGLDGVENKELALADGMRKMTDEMLDRTEDYLLDLKDATKEQELLLKWVEYEIKYRNKLAEKEKLRAEYAEKWKKASKEELLNRQKEISELRKDIDPSKNREDRKKQTQELLQEYKAIEQLINKINEKEAESSKIAAKTADDYAKKSNQELAERLRLLEVEAKAKGESVSAQDRYNVYLQSYIDLLTKTEGAIKEGYPIEQKRLQQLEEAKKKVEEAADAEKKLAAAMEATKAATDAINSIKREVTPAEELQNQIDALEELKNKIKEASDAEIKEAQKNEKNQLSKQELIAGLNEAEKALVNEKIDAIAGKEESWWDKHEKRQNELLEMQQELDKLEVLSAEEKTKRLQELDEAYKQSKAAQIAELMSQINSYTSQSVDALNNASALMLDGIKYEAEAEQAILETKYRNGELSEEEYNEKLTESKKKAAKENYKIQMVQWSASVLQATANIAEGVTKAIAQGGIAGLITGGLVTAAGAVQIASIIGSKPIPPSFSTGGIVGGSSMYGDNIAANLNSREMVMNMSQQKGLWDFINGGSRGAGNGANIVINNSAANVVSARPQLTRGQIEIMIEARVNESMKSGRYDQSLSMAQEGMSGDYYGI